jgi:lysophospholipase L1-like esterase
MRRATALKIIVLFFFVSPYSLAQEPKAEQFKDGDVVCLVGDSITHGGTYHSVVELFYRTRFPAREFKVINCGICADTAEGALRRINWDILVHKPTAATIMLGMNDVGISLYGKNKVDEKFETAKANRNKTHFESMRQIIEKLKQAGCRITVIMPSIYDDTAEIEGEKREGANAGLGLYAENDRKLADEFQAGIVDFYNPMCRINAEQQNKNAAYTLVGKDRVHPGPVGHFVMAYQFLKAQGMPEYVSKIALDAAAGKSADLINCEITDIKTQDASVGFTCLEKAMPFPVSGDVKPALELVPFMETFNKQILAIANLPEGKYELKIDGTKVGEYQSADLAKGIDLASNTKTPQYIQAEKIRVLIEKKRAVSTRIRDIAAAEHLFLKRKDGDATDFDTNKKFFEDLLEQNKTYNIRSRFSKKYLEEKPREKETYSQIAQIEKELAEAVILTAHDFSVTKMR